MYSKLRTPNALIFEQRLQFLEQHKSLKLFCVFTQDDGCLKNKLPENLFILINLENQTWKSTPVRRGTTKRQKLELIWTNSFSLKFSPLLAAFFPRDYVWRGTSKRVAEGWHRNWSALPLVVLNGKVDCLLWFHFGGWLGTVDSVGRISTRNCKVFASVSSSVELVTLGYN